MNKLGLLKNCKLIMKMLKFFKEAEKRCQIGQLNQQ